MFNIKLVSSQIKAFLDEKIDSFKECKKITSLEELERALSDLAPDMPTVLDCQLDMDEFVLPMIPPGGCVQDLITRRN